MQYRNVVTLALIALCSWSMSIEGAKPNPENCPCFDPVEQDGMRDVLVGLQCIDRTELSRRWYTYRLDIWESVGGMCAEVWTRPNVKQDSAYCSVAIGHVLDSGACSTWPKTFYYLTTEQEALGCYAGWKVVEAYIETLPDCE